MAYADKYNGANTIELGFVNEYEQIKGVLWCPGARQSGFNALGKILTWEVNPSAKTADTFVMDLTATPTWNNFTSINQAFQVCIFILTHNLCLVLIFILYDRVINFDLSISR